MTLFILAVGGSSSAFFAFLEFQFIGRKFTFCIIIFVISVQVRAVEKVTAPSPKRNQFGDLAI